MLIMSMGVSVDGFVAGRDGDISWGAPSDEQFRFSLGQVGELGAYLLGRRLHEMMQVWETDPAIRSTPDREAFADMWCAMPKVVFSRTLTQVEGSNARLATGSVAEEVAAALAGTDRPVSIGGPQLAAQALGLLDEVRLFRNPVVLGGGLPMLPPVPDPLELELVESRTFPPRVVYERYRVARP